MGDETVQAVLADYRTANIDEKTRAMLGFLEKLTLQPDQITPADADALGRAGISKGDAVDAVYVCFLFNLIDRVADTLDFEPESKDRLPSSAKMLLQRGYVQG
ncbi:MAG: carboxymuconolactone decarboxylase family protein [Phycisphaerae bacterium]